MDLQKAFLFFKDLHKNQIYPDGSPYRPHLLRVGNILEYYLKLYEEGDKSIINSIIIAGYGHDSIEDTDITKEKLHIQFDTYVSGLIFGMTNEQDDAHTDIYVQKIATASEEVRLIKLADMCDNYQGMIYKTNDQKTAIFFKEKIMSIIEPMYQKIITTKFPIYSKTSANLIADVKRFHDLATSIINQSI